MKYQHWLSLNILYFTFKNIGVGSTSSGVYCIDYSTNIKLFISIIIFRIVQLSQLNFTIKGSNRLRVVNFYFLRARTVLTTYRQYFWAMSLVNISDILPSSSIVSSISPIINSLKHLSCNFKNTALLEIYIILHTNS